MSESRVSGSRTRELPVADLEARGRFGAGTDEPGCEIAILSPMTTILVIARHRKKRVLEQAMAQVKGLDVRWAGGDQFFVVARDGKDGELEQKLRAKLGDIASIVDQSHGRVMFEIKGSSAREILRKGTPVDLRDTRFPVGTSAMTQMAHVGVHLTRVAEDAYQVSVFRGFSESFMEWLKTHALAYGVSIS